MQPSASPGSDIDASARKSVIRNGLVVWQGTEPITNDMVKQEEMADDLLRGFGCLRGKIQIASDFDAPLEDFQSYR